MEHKIEKLLDDCQLNWTVSKRELILDNEPSGYVATQRDDNKELFGVFKNYEVFQNSELAELVYRVAEKERLTVRSGGHFNGGGKVYIQLLDNFTSGIGENNDVIENYMTAINSHDGSSSLRFGYTNLVVSCQNSFWGVYKSLKNSMRHTATMREKVEQAVIDIEYAREQKEKMVETFFKLSEVALTQKMIRDVIGLVFNTNYEDLLQAPKRTKDNMSTLIECIVGETTEKGHTAWGLFNGITKYTTHHAGTDKGRAASKAFGTSGRVDNKVLTNLITM